MKQSVMNGSFFLKRIFFILFLFILCRGFAYETSLEAKVQYRVLVLNSYHYGYAWSDGEMKGIIETLENSFPDADVLVEFLDAKHFPDSYHEQAVRKMLEDKYPSAVFSLIIAVDNPALEFLLNYREKLFSGVPVVFCGINDYAPSLLRGNTNITGVAQLMDIEGTLKVMRKLHPQADKLYVLHDNTISGTAMRHEMETVLRASPAEWKTEWMNNLSIEEILTRLKGISSDSLVMLLSFSRDKEGTVFKSSDISSMVSQASPVPVYCTHEEFLGFGAAGGSLLSGRFHGAYAAEMAVRILRGETADSIPVMTQSTSKIMFDENVLQRFSLPASQFFPESLVINKPENFYRKYRTHISMALGVIALLTLCVFFLALNILRRRKAEQELIFEKEFSEAVLNSLPGVFFMYDSDLRLIKWNKCLADRLDAGEEDLSGRSIYASIPEEELSEFRKKFDLVTQEGVAFGELNILGKGGRRVPYLLAGTWISRREKKYLLGVGIDISELKKSEEEKRELAMAIEQASEAVLITDRDGHIIYVNPAFTTITGYSSEEVQGKTPGLLKSDQQSEKFYRDFWATIRRGDVWKGRVFNKKKDGTVYPEELTVSPVRNQSGEIIHYISVRRDISAQIKLENQLRQAQKMEAIGTLAGGIAHDFNNILTAITGYTELAVDFVTNTSEVLSFLNESLKAQLRAKDLIRQILTLSRQKEQEVKPVKLSPIIKEVVKFMKASLPSTIDVNYFILTEKDCVLGDPTQIHQVLMNLCTNAAHAMKEHGGVLELSLDLSSLNQEEISFDSFKKGPYVRLSVKDTGTGIPKEHIERIFEPYFTTKDPGQGTGLGLAVVHGIIKSLNGEIKVYSEPGKGTVFHVYIPCVDYSEQPAENLSAPVPVGRESILFVDDEKSIVTVVTRILANLGYKITSTTFPKEALALFQNSPSSFDLLITDKTMPELTGFDLIKAIKKIRKDIPVILCTGLNEKEDQDKVEDSGVDYLFIKPFQKAVFAAAIRSVLDRTK